MEIFTSEDLKVELDEDGFLFVAGDDRCWGVEGIGKARLNVSQIRVLIERLKGFI